MVVTVVEPIKVSGRQAVILADITIDTMVANETLDALSSSKSLSETVENFHV